MPARVIIVHDEPRFIEELSTALSGCGLKVAAFPDPLTALDQLEVAETVELLITRITFPSGRSNGAALARMLRLRRPDAKVLFVANPDLQADLEGLGEFLSRTASIPAIADAAVRLLNSEP